MSELIARLRETINDPAGNESVFTDDAMQRFLDANRVEVSYLQLTPIPRYLEGGTRVRIEYVAPCGDWEGDARLTGASYQTLTPSTADLRTGRWTFAADQPEPVELTGKAYNLAAAAARALREWANRVALDHDFSASGKSLSESQKHAMLLKSAETFEKQAEYWPGLSLPSDYGGGVGSGRWRQTDFAAPRRRW